VPGIILLQEAFGVNHHIRSGIDRLAAAATADDFGCSTAAAPGPGYLLGFATRTVPRYAAINNTDLLPTGRSFDYFLTQPRRSR
jgi:carboxymethylenebutenolidase